MFFLTNRSVTIVTTAEFVLQTEPQSTVQSVKLWLNYLMSIMLLEMRIGSSVRFLSFLFFSSDTPIIHCLLLFPLFYLPFIFSFPLYCCSDEGWAHLLYFLRLTLDLPCCVTRHWDLKQSHFPLILRTSLNTATEPKLILLIYLFLLINSLKTGRQDLWQNLRASSLINLITWHTDVCKARQKSKKAKFIWCF